MKNEISWPIDVHRWSDYPEINNFVNLIYEKHFRLKNPAIIKKYLKVVLLDLYVAWNEHHDMKIGVHMNRNAYNQCQQIEIIRKEQRHYQNYGCQYPYTICIRWFNSYLYK